MKTLNIKKIAVICACVMVVVVGAILFFVLRPTQMAADIPPNTAGPELKTGRYYIDGDTQQYYFEVFDNGTMQLKDVDYMEYVSWKAFEGEPTEEQVEALKVEADELSKPMPYRSVTYPSSDEGGRTAILTHWTEDADGHVCGDGFDYIDENTIKRGAQQVFKFVDETAAATYSAPENSTRIVDSLSYKAAQADK